jgi:hypothetical protein
MLLSNGLRNHTVQASAGKKHPLVSSPAVVKRQSGGSSVRIEKKQLAQLPLSQTIQREQARDVRDINKLPTGIREVVGLLYGALKLPSDVVGLLSLLTSELPDQLVQRLGQNPLAWSNFVERNFGGWKGQPVKGFVYDFLTKDPPHYSPGDASSYNNALLKIEVALALKFARSFGKEVVKFSDHPTDKQAYLIARAAYRHVLSGTEESQGNLGLGLFTMLTNVGDFFDAAHAIKGAAKSARMVHSLLSAGGVSHIQKLEKSIEVLLKDAAQVKSFNSIKPEEAKRIDGAIESLRQAFEDGDSKAMYKAMNDLKRENELIRRDIGARRGGHVADDATHTRNRPHGDGRVTKHGVDNVLADPQALVSDLRRKGDTAVSQVDSSGGSTAHGWRPVEKPTQQIVRENEAAVRRYEANRAREQIRANQAAEIAAAENQLRQNEFNAQTAPFREATVTELRDFARGSDASAFGSAPPINGQQGSGQHFGARENHASGFGDETTTRSSRTQSSQANASDATGRRASSFGVGTLIVDPQHAVFKQPVLVNGQIFRLDPQNFTLVDSSGRPAAVSPHDYVLADATRFINDLSDGKKISARDATKSRQYLQEIEPLLTYGQSASDVNKVKVAAGYLEATELLEKLVQLKRARTSPTIKLKIQIANAAIDAAVRKLHSLGAADAVDRVSRAKRNINRQSFEIEVPDSLRKHLDQTFPRGWSIATGGSSTAGLVTAKDFGTATVGTLTSGRGSVTFAPFSSAHGKPITAALSPNTIYSNLNSVGTQQATVIQDTRLQPSQRAVPGDSASGVAVDGGGGTGGPNKPRKTGGANGGDSSPNGPNGPNDPGRRIDLLNLKDSPRDFEAAAVSNFENHPLGQRGRGELSGGGRAQAGAFGEVRGGSLAEIEANARQRIHELVESKTLKDFGQVGSYNAVYRHRDGRIVRVGEVGSSEILFSERLSRVEPKGNYRLGARISLTESLYLPKHSADQGLPTGIGKPILYNELVADRKGTRGFGVFVLEDAGEAAGIVLRSASLSDRATISREMINAVAHLHSLNAVHLDAHLGNFVVSRNANRPLVVTLIDHDRVKALGNSTLSDKGKTAREIEDAFSTDLVYVVRSLSAMNGKRSEEYLLLYRRAIERLDTPAVGEGRAAFENRKQLLLRLASQENYEKYLAAFENVAPPGKTPQKMTTTAPFGNGVPARYGNLDSTKP